MKEAFVVPHADLKRLAWLATWGAMVSVEASSRRRAEEDAELVMRYRYLTGLEEGK